MASKDLIGTVLSRARGTVSAEHVAAFAEALGDPNPRYRGPDAVAPPTYPLAFMTQVPQEDTGGFAKLGLDVTTLVHGEQEFEYVRPLRPGDTLALTTRVSDVYEKRGGSGVLEFVVMETEAVDDDGTQVFFARNTIISRRPA